MKRILWLCCLVLLLSSCIPLAMLRPATPTRGTDITVGGSVLIPVGSGATVSGLPYLAFSRGDGDSEFNLSAQLGIRGGIKQKLSDGFSIDAGVTLPFLFLFPSSVGIPFAVDGALIIGLEPFYLSPRIQWLGFGINNSFASGFLYQVAAGYSDPAWIAEVGATFSGQGGGVLLGVSAGLRF